MAAPASPGLRAERLDAADARFFLSRTGFAPAEAEVARYTGLTREDAVARRLAEAAAAPVPEAPEWTREALAARKRARDLSDEERRARRELEQKQIFDLRGWWLRQMLSTPAPLAERMTLFWHNHFVSSHQKVQVAQLMYRQNALFRRQALGNFATLLHEASRDPAMLLYLDNAVNRKGAPNENFAREVMELFTLGEGHYSEQDIKEAARAFTGWSVDRDDGEFRTRPAQHDDGIKTVLGQSGAFDGDAVLDILLAQPACADYIASRLWREFISPEPDAAEVARIAARLRESGYDIAAALRTLFLSPAFWARENRAMLVKSPVELVVGTVRQFEIDYGDPLPFSFAVAQLGQNLFNPPNVKGWPGGEAWINSSSLLARKSVLERVFRSIEMGRPAPSMATAAGSTEDMAMARPAGARAKPDELGKVRGQAALGRAGQVRFANASAQIVFHADAWLGRFGLAQDAAPDVRQRLAIQKTVLATEPSSPIRADLSGVAYLRTLLMDPVYQLK